MLVLLCHFDSTLLIYISASLSTHQTSRTRRSSSEKLLKIQKHILKSFGERSFSFVAPSVWNWLPACLQDQTTLSEFKTQLKTFLLNRPFHKLRQTIPVTIHYVRVYVYVRVWCVLAQNNELSIRGAIAVVFVLGLLFACSHCFGVFVFLLCLFALSLMSCYTVAIVFRGFVRDVATISATDGAVHE